jgi:predicted nucleic acid-binding protein
LLLLDTNVICELRKPRPDVALNTWYASQNPEELCISVVTIFEIQIGIERTRTCNPDVAAAVNDWLEAKVVPSFSGRVLQFELEASRLYAQMLTTPDLYEFVLFDPRSKKQRTGADLMIAAMAIASGAALVTRDMADFGRISRHFPLPGLINPFDSDGMMAPVLAAE